MASSSPILLTTNRGTISSPNFPNNYYNNADCKWIIKAPGDRDVSYSFVKQLSYSAVSGKITANNFRFEALGKTQVNAVHQQKLREY